MTLSDIVFSGGAGQFWEWRFFTVGGTGYTVIDSFTAEDGQEKPYNFTFFIDPIAYSINNFGLIQLARGGTNAGGKRKKAFWLIMSGEQQV